MAKHSKQTKEPVYYKGEPPVWFQFLMKNGIYDTAVNLDEAGWARQVESRLSYKSPEKLETYDLSDDDKAKGYSRYKAVRLIQEQGIVEPIEDIYASQMTTYQGLTELTLRKHHTKDLNDYMFNLDGEGEDYIQYGYLSDALGYGKDIRCISVDLTLPNSILKEQFVLFIDNKKHVLEEVIGESIKIMNGKRNSWIKSAVMPFLDLQFWAVENDINLSNEYYSKKIFKPDEIKGGSSVTRTTKDGAKEFLAMDRFNLLNKS